MKNIRLTLLLLLSIILFSGFWSGDSDKEARKDRVTQNYETLQ